MSLFVFFMSQWNQKDIILKQIENKLKVQNETILSSWQTSYKKEKILGFHQPPFYFSIYRKSSSDTLNRVQDPKIRNQLEAFAYQIGSWEKTDKFYKTVLIRLEEENQKNKTELINDLRNLSHNPTENRFNKFPVLQQHFLKTAETFQPLNNYLLKWKWNGATNQYHSWISNFITGNFGTSIIDGSSVNKKIGRSIYWTLCLSILSILISFAIAIPTAFYSALNPQKRGSKLLDKLFLLFFALPNFWVATLLIVFLASGDYFNWFPTYGIGFPSENASFLDVLGIRIRHLILPLIALSYGSIAFIYEQLKTSIKTELKKDYIVTAKAKGLSVNYINKYQLFRNASFPLITMLGGIIPAIFSGSFIIEYIFSIPGMGKLTVDSILSRDFPVIYFLLLLATLLSMIGLLLADILYYYVDPRVQYSTEK